MSAPLLSLPGDPVSEIEYCSDIASSFACKSSTSANHYQPKSLEILIHFYEVATVRYAKTLTKALLSRSSMLVKVGEKVTSNYVYSIGVNSLAFEIGSNGFSSHRFPNPMTARVGPCAAYVGVKMRN